MHRFILWVCSYLRTLSAATCITSGIGILFSRCSGLKSAVHLIKRNYLLQWIHEYKKNLPISHSGDFYLAPIKACVLYTTFYFESDIMDECIYGDIFILITICQKQTGFIFISLI